MTDRLADSHLHLFKRGMPAATGRAVLGYDSELDAYEAFRRKYNIAAGLIVGYDADGIDPGNSAHILSLAQTRPWMATLAYVEPDPPPTYEAIEQLLEDGHRGLAIYATDPARATALTKWPDSIWDVLNRWRAIVSFNARPPAMDDLVKIVRRQSGACFLFSHIGLPGRQSGAPSLDEATQRLALLLALAEHQNVMVKISGLYAISDPSHGYPHDAARPFIELVLDRFGPSRCLWGSDFSPALEHVSFPQTVDNPWLDRLGPSERAAVMGENLLKLLANTKRG